MTHYQVLEVPPHAPAADIRLAYRRLALLTHPDRTPDPAAHARFLAINAAYEVLSDPARRFAYDRQLASPTLAPPAAGPTMSSGRARDEARRAAARAARPPRPVLSPEERILGPHAQIYLQYMNWARLFNGLVVVFCLLLGLDYFLAQPLPEERIITQETTSEYSRRGNVSRVYYIYTTPNVRFRSMYEYPEGTVLTMRITPMFSQVLSFRNAHDSAEYDYDNRDLTMYSLFGVLPLMMLIAGIVGLWPGPLSKRPVDSALSAALMLPIVLWLLATT